VVEKERKKEVDIIKKREKIIALVVGRVVDNHHPSFTHAHYAVKECLSIDRFIQK
jgi:hypothetical protein